MDDTHTAAALNGRLHQKDTTAVVPMARSAMPTSNWNGLTCQPMFAAATDGKNKWNTAAHRPVTPIGKSRIHDRNRSGVDHLPRRKAAISGAAASRKAGRLRNTKPTDPAITDDDSHR